MSRRFGLTAAVAALTLAACGGPPPSPVAAPPPADPGVVTAGDYELRYGTLAAVDLPREVAAAYGVARRPGTLVVSVSVLRRDGGALPKPVGAKLRGRYRSLVGEPVALEFREFRAGGAPSWIAEVAPTAPGIVLIEIEAEPDGAARRLVANLRRDAPTR